jgi:hypothetical protein
MARKMCHQAALLIPTRRVDMWLQCHIGPVGYSQDTTIVQGDPTGRCHTADRVQRGRVIGLNVPHAVEDIICYSYPLVS